MERPYTLSGVDIINYTVMLDKKEYMHNVNGSHNNTVVDDPYRNSTSCENHTICVSATTLAGTSNLSCIEAILIGGKKTIALYLLSFCTAYLVKLQ